MNEFSLKISIYVASDHVLFNCLDVYIVYYLSKFTLMCIVCKYVRVDMLLL